jgi:hypothetical protein
LRNANHESPLDIAVRTGKFNICQLLLIHCPSIALQVCLHKLLNSKMNNKEGQISKLNNINTIIHLSFVYSVRRIVVPPLPLPLRLRQFQIIHFMLQPNWAISIVWRHC